MCEIAERQIDSSMTFFYKFVIPTIVLGVTLAWAIGVSFFFGIQHRPPSPAIGCIGLVVFGICLYGFVRSNFPLKQVWLRAEGLRVSNFRDAIVVSFGEIEEVRQETQSRERFVVVTLYDDSPLGSRFTFLPKKLISPWFFPRGEDEVVIELRNRVMAARKVGKPSSNPDAEWGRSPMADVELDGPF